MTGAGLSGTEQANAPFMPLNGILCGPAYHSTPIHDRPLSLRQPSLLSLSSRLSFPSFDMLRRRRMNPLLTADVLIQTLDHRLSRSSTFHVISPQNQYLGETLHLHFYWSVSPRRL